MAKILVIEDEEEIRTNLKYFLEAEDFEVIVASKGITGIELARKCLPDVIISDIMMPGMDGYMVLEQLRLDPSTQHIPLIFLTAKISRDDLRQGMQLGADDYISKPFTQQELLDSVKTRLQRQATLKSSFLRPVTSKVLSATTSIKVLLDSIETGTVAGVEAQGQYLSGYADNKANGYTENSMQAGRSSSVSINKKVFSNGFAINYDMNTVSVEGQEVKLSPRQFKLLSFLAENAGKIVTHRDLLFKVWGPEYENESRYLHVFVNQLRQKIEPDPHNPRYIITERGFGYRFIKQ